MLGQLITEKVDYVNDQQSFGEKVKAPEGKSLSWFGQRSKETRLLELKCFENIRFVGLEAAIESRKRNSSTDKKHLCSQLFEKTSLSPLHPEDSSGGSVILSLLKLS